jgi:predicted DNA-binding transcriptional regulator AlpA
VTFDEKLAELVREAVAPMLAAELERLECRLVERLTAVVPLPSPPSGAPTSLLTRQEVARRLGVAPRTLHRLVVGGKFPKPIQIAPNRVGWDTADVVAWLKRRGGEP